MHPTIESGRSLIDERGRAFDFDTGDHVALEIHPPGKPCVQANEFIGYRGELTSNGIAIGEGECGLMIRRVVGFFS